MGIGGLKYKFDADLMEKILSGGLCHGAGDGRAGGKYEVCVEQAVSLCLGISMTDCPDSCVGRSVSMIGRLLNDETWSSEKARAAGLRKFAYAQLGSHAINNDRFERDLDRIVTAELRPAMGDLDGILGAARKAMRLEGERRDRYLCAIADMAIRALRMQIPGQPYNQPPIQEKKNAKAKGS